VLREQLSRQKEEIRSSPSFKKSLCYLASTSSHHHLYLYCSLTGAKHDQVKKYNIDVIVAAGRDEIS